MAEDNDTCAIIIGEMSVEGNKLEDATIGILMEIDYVLCNCDASSL